MVLEPESSKSRFSMGELASLFGRKGARPPPLLQKAGAGKKSQRGEGGAPVSKEKEFLSLSVAGFAACCIWINGLGGLPALDTYVCIFTSVVLSSCVLSLSGVF